MLNRYRRLLVVTVLLWATVGVAGRALAVTFTEFQLPKSSGPIDITTGPDGALWFTDGTGLRVGRITTDGVITEFPIPIPLGVGGSLHPVHPSPLWRLHRHHDRAGRRPVVHRN
jgi:virginiamycin B lyase